MKTNTCFIACLKTHFVYCSQFHNSQVNTTALHNVNKDFMLDMLLKGFVSGSAMIAVSLSSPFFELKPDGDAAFIGGWCLFKGGI